MATAAQTWIDRSEARRALLSIDPADVRIVWEHPIVGPAYLSFTFEGLEDLRALRASLIEQAYGKTFSEACEAGEGDAFLDYYSAQPAVHDALAERFGSPGVWAGLSLADVQSRWLHNALAAQKVAA